MWSPRQVRPGRPPAWGGQGQVLTIDTTQHSPGRHVVPVGHLEDRLHIVRPHVLVLVIKVMAMTRLMVMMTSVMTRPTCR